MCVCEWACVWMCLSFQPARFAVYKFNPTNDIDDNNGDDDDCSDDEEKVETAHNNMQSYLL